MSSLQESPSLLNESRKLGRSAHTVYTFLWDAAQMSSSRKIYNTNNYTIKGLAGELLMKRETVARAIDKLLDSGLIQIAGEEKNPNGSNNTIWGITHPAMLEAVRHANDLMGPPSKRLALQRTKAKKVNLEESQAEIYF